MAKSASRYQIDIPIQLEKLNALKQRLEKAEFREIEMWHKLAKKYRLFDRRMDYDLLEAAFADIACRVEDEKESVVFSLQQKVNRTELKLSSMKTQHRKQDAHEKIQLGGLVVKAGLRDEDKAVILGALLDARKALESNDEEQIKAWEALGAMALNKP